MIILSSSALQVSSLVSAKIEEKEESDLSAKRALLESEKIVNRFHAQHHLLCTVLL